MGATPVAVKLILASSLPTQDGFVTDGCTFSSANSVTVTLSICVQLFASVMNTIYVPGGNELTSSVVLKFDQKKEYPPAPPDTVRSAAPVLVPKQSELVGTIDEAIAEGSFNVPLV